MPAQGRLGDQAQVPSDSHGCPGCAHSCIGPAIEGSPDVNVNGRPALRVGDPGVHSACCGPNTWNAAVGAPHVFINGKAAHRLGDKTTHCGGQGKLVEGSGDVFVGDSGGGGGVSERPQPKSGKHEIWVVLKSELTQRPLADVDYDVLDAGGAAVASGTTGEDGVVRHDVPPGSYRVVVKQEDPTGDLWLHLFAADLLSPLPNSAYSLTGPSGSLSGTTDAQGQLRQGGVLLGEYVVQAGGGEAHVTAVAGPDSPCAVALAGAVPP